MSSSSTPAFSSLPLFRGERSVQERLKQAERVFLPAIVLGELHFGAEGSERPAEQRERVRELAGTCTQLVCDADTARHYGRIQQALRKRGRPIPENDLSGLPPSPSSMSSSWSRATSTFSRSKA